MVAVLATTIIYYPNTIARALNTRRIKGNVTHGDIMNAR